MNKKLNWKESDPRPALHGWCPGDYFCTCVICNCRFGGAKRSYNCADCAYELPLGSLEVIKEVK